MGSTLFHYTTPHGLLGIFAGCSLWLSDAEFLNDAVELSFALDEMRRLVSGHEQRLISTYGETSPEHAWIRRTQALSSVLEEWTAPDTIETDVRRVMYVACFCEDGDLLSQWRGYGPDGGYAVGIDSERVCSSPLVAVDAVSYGLQGLEEEIDVLVSGLADETSEQGMTALVDALMRRASLTKHPSFSEEREWRLLCSGAAVEAAGLDLRWRATPFGIASHLDMAIETGSIRTVVVGPGPHSRARARGVRRMLDAQGLAEVRIDVSESPFRR